LEAPCEAAVQALSAGMLFEQHGHQQLVTGTQGHVHKLHPKRPLYAEISVSRASKRMTHAQSRGQQPMQASAAVGSDGQQQEAQVAAAGSNSGDRSWAARWPPQTVRCVQTCPTIMRSRKLRTLHSRQQGIREQCSMGLLQAPVLGSKQVSPLAAAPCTQTHLAVFTL
jgi:hypothetical protein